MHLTQISATRHEVRDTRDRLVGHVVCMYVGAYQAIRLGRRIGKPQPTAAKAAALLEI